MSTWEEQAIQIVTALNARSALIDQVISDIIKESDNARLVEGKKSYE